MPPRSKAAPSPAQGQPSELDRLKRENRRLRDELYLARRNLINLMDLQGLLSAYRSAHDFDQVDEWRRAAAATVLTAALVRPGEEMGDPRWPRALCPLCRQGAQGTRDVRGYAVPEGLRRHLLGELNSRQCPVFAAAEAIARDSVWERQQAGWHPAWP